MEELAKVISKFESIEWLVAEIRAGENVETVEKLTEYLESELSYATEQQNKEEQKMPKAVLIMDMPESCGECNFNDFGANGILTCICIDDYMELEDDMDTCRPDWCPFRELPEKMEVCGTYNADYYAKGGKMPSYKTGWNACLDAITESEEKQNE